MNPLARSCRRLGISDAEQSLRLVAFQIAWSGPYAHIRDNTLRFGYALVHSIQPIKNREVLDAWWSWCGSGSVPQALRSRRPIPPIIRPIVEAYKAALASHGREVETMEDAA